MCTIAYTSSCRLIDSPTLIASSIHLPSSSLARISANATHSHSMSAARCAINLHKRWPLDASLFCDDCARNAVASSLTSGNHECRLQQIPQRNDQWKIACDRTAVAAALTVRRQEPQTEHPF